MTLLITLTLLIIKAIKVLSNLYKLQIEKHKPIIVQRCSGKAHNIYKCYHTIYGSSNITTLA